MIVFVNGSKEDTKDRSSVLDILESKDLKPDSVVVELNKNIIETDDYSKTVLNENDSLEILEFVGGG